MLLSVFQNKMSLNKTPKINYKYLILDDENTSNLIYQLEK